MFSNNNNTVSNNTDVSNVSKNGKMMKKPPPIRYQPYINPQPMPTKEELAKIADLWENNKGGFRDYSIDDLANKFASLKIS